MTDEQITQTLANEWPYRRSQSRWVGGDHTVEAHIVSELQEVGGSCEAKRVWHKKHTWSGTNSAAVVYMHQSAVDNPIVDGKVVLFREPLPDNPAIHRVLFLVQSKGVSLRVVDGWQIGSKIVVCQDPVRAMVGMIRGRMEGA